MKTLSLTTALLTLLAIAQWSYAEIANWDFHHQEYFTRYTTHGELIHGHEFGLVKNPGDCSKDILYISWSAYDPEIKQFTGQNAIITFTIDGQEIQQNVPLLTAYEWIPGGLTLLAFTNVRASQRLLRLMEEGESLELAISAPQGLRDMLEDKSDRFSLVGFKAARDNARKLCAAAGETGLPAISAPTRGPYLGSLINRRSTLVCIHEKHALLQ
jgi:hypothetical protein